MRPSGTLHRAIKSFERAGGQYPQLCRLARPFAEGQAEVGISIIIGSNIWNLAIILGLSTFAPPTGHGLRLGKEGRDIRLVALYTIAISLLTLLALTLLATAQPDRGGQPTFAAPLALPLTNLLTLFLFAALVSHALRRFPQASEEVSNDQAKSAVVNAASPGAATSTSLGEAPRFIVTAVFALLLALGGVLVMVQAGQAFALDVHFSPVLLGLVVLADATSLPNTVVAVSMARSNRVAACVEEVLTSNNINIVLGTTLPLFLWHTLLHDHLLLELDIP